MIRGEGEFEVLQPAGAPAGEPLSPRSAARLDTGRPAVRPRSGGETVDLAFELLRDRFVLFVGLSAALWVPVRALVPIVGPGVWASDPGGWQVPLWLASTGFVAVSTALVQTFATALVSLLVQAHQDGADLPLGTAFRRALARLPALVLIAIVVGIVTGVGTILCFVPGILLSWKLYLAPSACVLERSGVGASFSRSFELTRGSFARWLAAWIVVAVLGGLFASVAALGDQPQARSHVVQELGVSGPVFDVALALLSSIFYGVSTALTAVVATAFYLDCRTRRDGSDLRDRLARLAEAAR